LPELGNPAEQAGVLEALNGSRADDVQPGLLMDGAKRVLAPQAETPKLHKVLAQAGLGSRLEMEQLIAEGRISVNNEPAHTGQRIQFGDQIKVNGKPIRFASRRRPRACHGLPQAGGRGRHPRRPAKPPHRVPPPAASCRRASGSRWAGWTSTPKACCCSPVRANWPTS
jgi:hypothetical protein